MPRYYCFEVVYKISSSNDHYFGRKQGSTEPAKTTNLARARKTTRAWQPCFIKAPAVVRPTRASCPDNYRLAAMLYLIRRTRTGRALNWVAAVLFQRNLRICD